MFITKNSIYSWKGRFFIIMACMLVLTSTCFATSQAKDLTLPDGRGTLTSNTWRQTRHTISGNTYQWEWQVSAVYTGSIKVEWIKTEWYSSADLKNSASISMGVSLDGAHASSSSSWQNISTVKKHWTNNNGAKSSDWRSNIVISPSVDYKDDTISTINTAEVKLDKIAKTYVINSGV